MSNVKVIAPDGTPGTVPAEQIADAERSGYQVVTPEMEAASARTEKYGDVGHQALAGLAGVARGTTLGLSDVALTKSGLVKPETLKALEDEHPGTSLAGEIGGAIAPALLTGGGTAPEAGASIAAKIASKTAAGAVSGLGTAVETGISKGVSKLVSSQVAGKMVGAVARGATEGELYNLGHNISEATLGDEQITAERLLAHSGDAMAIGGGLGFGITAAGLAAKAAAQKASGALSGLQEWLQKASPLSNPDTVNKYADAMAAKSGMDADVVKKLISNPGTPEGMAFRERFGSTGEFLSPDERDALGREFRETFDATQSELTAARKQAIAEIRPKEIETLLRDADAGAASETAFKLADDLRAGIKTVTENPDLYPSQGVAKKLSDIVDGYEKRLLSDVESPADLFNLVNKTKRRIDDNLGHWGKEFRSEYKDTAKLVQQLRGGFKDALEDESVWGVAAARQSAFNGRVTEHLDAEKEMLKAFGTKRIGRGGIAKYEINSKKVNTFISQTGASRSDTATNALQNYLSSAKQLTQEIENSSMHAAVPFDRAGVDSLIEKSRGIAADAEKKMGLESKVRQSARLDDIGYNSFAGTAATAMGAVAGGLPGAAAAAGAVRAAGAAVNATANPVNLAKTLARIEGFAMGPAKQMSKHIDGMIDRASQAGSAIQRGTGEATTRIVDAQQDDLKQFRETQTRLARIASYGLGHAEQLQQGLAQLSDHAPKTQQAIINKQMQVAQFLQSKMPADPFGATTTNPKLSPWNPSDTQLARFGRYQQAALDPMSVLRGAIGGMVSKEGVETVQALYPHLFDDFKGALFQQVAVEGKEIPQQSAIALSVLLGVPLTPNMSPALRATLQANWGPAKKDQGDKPPRLSNRESKTAQNLKTDSERHSEH